MRFNGLTANVGGRQSGNIGFTIKKLADGSLGVGCSSRQIHGNQNPIASVENQSVVIAELKKMFPSRTIRVTPHPKHSVDNMGTFVRMVKNE